MKNPINITDLSVSYDSKSVIDNFSYTFEPHCFYAIMGASGIGKTSLINSIMGLIEYEGTINSDEMPVIAAVFQEDRLCEGISVYRNIRMTCGKQFSKEYICELIDSFGLGDCAFKKVSGLSGGMKRRVAILRAITAPHNLLIMDEPFKGLDEETKQNIMSKVKKMTSDDTVIMVTHDISEAKYFNAKIINLN